MHTPADDSFVPHISERFWSSSHGKWVIGRDRLVNLRRNLHLWRFNCPQDRWAIRRSNSENSQSHAKPYRLHNVSSRKNGHCICIKIPKCICILLPHTYPTLIQFRANLRSIKCQKPENLPNKYRFNWNLKTCFEFTFQFNWPIWSIIFRFVCHWKRTPQHRHSFIKLQIFVRMNKYNLSSDHSFWLKYSVGLQWCASISNVAASQTQTEQFADFSFASSATNCILEPVFAHGSHHVIIPVTIIDPNSGTANSQ